MIHVETQNVLLATRTMERRISSTSVLQCPDHLAWMCSWDMLGCCPPRILNTDQTKNWDIQTIILGWDLARIFLSSLKPKALPKTNKSVVYPCSSKMGGLSKQTSWDRELLTCLWSDSYISNQFFKQEKTRTLADTTLSLVRLNCPVLVASSISLKITAMRWWFFSFSGEWRVFSGNELGALLGWWLFTSWKEKNQDPSALKDLYMLSSTVSSKILRAIALKEGFHFEVRYFWDLLLNFFCSVEGLRHFSLFWVIPLGNTNWL